MESRDCPTIFIELYEGLKVKSHLVVRSKAQVRTTVPKFSSVCSSIFKKIVWFHRLAKKGWDWRDVWLPTSH